MANRKGKNNTSKPSPDDRNAYLRYSGIAFELAAFNLLCVWGGYELSERYSPGTHWILILAVLFTVAGSIYYLFKRLNN